MKNTALEKRTAHPGLEGANRTRLFGLIDKIDIGLLNKDEINVVRIHVRQMLRLRHLHSQKFQL